MAKQTDTIIIKRYASRRLYNSDISEYVTLNEVADLIREGKNIQVIDKKTGEDLTRQYLLQIISEQEATGETAFPAAVLMDVIRAYKDSTQSMMPDFLSRSYEIFKEQQAMFLGQQKDMVNKATSAQKAAFDPLALWQDKMDLWLGKGLTGDPASGWGQNMWQAQQKAFFEGAMAGFMPKKKADADSKDAPAKPKTQGETSKDDEIAEMKRQLAALTQKLSDL